VSEGRKYDGEKPQLYLLPPKSITEVGKVLTFGAKKYDAHNWRKVDDLQNRYSSAALRHIFAHIDGPRKCLLYPANNSSPPSPDNATET